MNRSWQASINVHPQPSGSRYRPEIDGLRAVAVIAVIINHFDENLLPSGFLGVDIFFAISGYVITSSLYGHRLEKLSEFLLGFYGRRVKRLVPALATCVLLTGIAMCMINPSPGISLRTGIAALFGFSNVFLYSLSTNYFAPITELNPFTHTWSLGVEEQFYLLFPLFFWFSGVGQKGPKSNLRLAGVIGLISFISLAGFLYYNNSDPSAAYFLMPWRFWELGAGVLSYVVIDRLRLARFSIRGIVPLVILLCMGWLFTFPLSQRMVTTPIAVVLTCLLFAGIRPGQYSHKLLACRPVVKIGLLSYSLYLWHWSVLTIARWTTGIHPWTTPFLIALMLSLSILSYLWIEVPLRRSRWTGSNAWNLVTGFSILGFISALFAAIGLVPGFSLYTGQRNGPRLVGQPSLTAPYLPDGAAGVGWRGKDCILSSNEDVGKKIDASNCHIGDVPKPAKRILVLGNSFAPSFTAAFDDIVKKDQILVTLIASWGASPVPEIPNKSSWQKANQYFWSSIVPHQIKQLQKGDVVFLVNDLFFLSPSKQDTLSRANNIQFRTGLERLSDELRPRGIHLAVLSSLPFAREAHCIPEVARKEWFNAFGGPCNFISKETTLGRIKPARKMLEDLENKKGIILVDLFPVFCDGDPCAYSTENGVVLYRDANSHPSVQAARLAAPIIRRELVERFLQKS